ncbi:hypothetical protein MK079_04900, partial [Candidatus Gracilibacteria bacterium]|nr:hypothetical protein [Candidatus Gracilibacteria bacterium]
MSDSSSIIHDTLFTFWQSVTLEMVIKFGVVYFFILWIALIFWVFRDISNRTDSILFQIISVLLMLFMGPLGIGIYLVIRPGRTLFEKYYHEIDENLEMFQEFIEYKIAEKKQPSPLTPLPEGEGDSQEEKSAKKV